MITINPLYAYSVIIIMNRKEVAFIVKQLLVYYKYYENISLYYEGIFILYLYYKAII